MTRFPGFLHPARPTAAGLPRDWHRGQLLAHLVTRHGWRTGVEIGVSYGVTLAHLLAACPALHMLGVDTWAPNPNAPEPPHWDAGHHARAHEAAQAVEMACIDRCTLLRAPSAEAAAMVDPGCLDFVWIDGDHGTDAVLADIAAWLPALKPGGWLLGHDIGWPTVRAAVDRAVPGYLIGPDDVWFRPLHPVPGWWVAA